MFLNYGCERIGRFGSSGGGSDSDRFVFLELFVVDNEISGGSLFVDDDDNDDEAISLEPIPRREVVAENLFIPLKNKSFTSVTVKSC